MLSTGPTDARLHEVVDGIDPVDLLLSRPADLVAWFEASILMAEKAYGKDNPVELRLDEQPDTSTQPFPSEPSPLQTEPLAPEIETPTDQQGFVGNATSSFAVAASNDDARFQFQTIDLAGINLGPYLEGIPLKSSITVNLPSGTNYNLHRLGGSTWTRAEGNSFSFKPG